MARDFIFTHFRAYQGWVIALVLCGILSGLFEPIIALTLKLLVDFLASKNPDHHIVFAIVLIIPFASCVNSLCWRAMDFVQLNVFIVVKKNMIEQLLLNALRDEKLSTNTFSGERANHIMTFANTVFTLSGFQTFGLIRSTVLLLASFGISFMINLYYGLFNLLWFAIVSRTIFKHSHYQGDLIGRYSKGLARISGLLTDVFSNVFIVKSFAGIPIEKRLLEHHCDQMVAEYRDYKSHTTKRLLAVNLLADSYVLITALTAASLFYIDQISAGSLVLLLSQSGNVVYTTTWSLNLAQQMIDGYGTCRACFEQLNSTVPPTRQRLVDQPLLGADVIVQHPPAPHSNSIEFDQVFFSFEQNTHVIAGISIQIAKGEKVGIVGLSGAGKSTFAKLLLGTLKPDSGSIRIQTTQGLGQSEAERIAAINYIAQDSPLFNRSIADNIGYAAPEQPYATIQSAAQHAQCADFIQACSQGYEYVVGEKGSNLSGGQKQRVSIARALLKTCEIIRIGRSNCWARCNYSDKSAAIDLPPI